MYQQEFVMFQNRVYLLIFICCLISTINVYAQKEDKSQKSASSLHPESGQSSNFQYFTLTKSEAPEKEKKGFNLFSSKSGKKSKSKYKGSYAWQLDQKILEYEQRMKRVAKRERKQAKLEKKPQYSDPLYFGHKKKPKKRKPGKRKLCKECLIVH